MRKSVVVLTISAAALTLTSSSRPALTQQAVESQGSEQQLGSVHFKISCNEVAQRRFDRAMRYQHSYWYLNAKEIFEEVLKADPTCAIC